MEVGEVFNEDHVIREAINVRRDSIMNGSYAWSINANAPNVFVVKIF